MTHDKPRPRIYFWNNEPSLKTDLEQDRESKTTKFSHDEQALYPLLIEFLSEEMELYYLRIDEKRSKNSHGNGGNRWLHPDVVALEP